MMEYTWRTKTGQFQSGESLYLNGICVGGYGWNACQPKHDKSKDWAGEVSLPSLKTKVVFGSTEEEIKATMERTVSGWFKEALAKAVKK